LGWPELLEHPFVRETAAERLKREKALADAVELADSSRAWKVRLVTDSLSLPHKLRDVIIAHRVVSWMAVRHSAVSCLTQRASLHAQ
jgi:hypothetical protein